MSNPPQFAPDNDVATGQDFGARVRVTDHTYVSGMADRLPGPQRLLYNQAS
jgi:hypothetical protein